MAHALKPSSHGMGTSFGFAKLLVIGALGGALGGTIGLLGFEARAAEPPLSVEGRLTLELQLEDRFEEVLFGKEGQFEVSTSRRGGVKAVTEIGLSSDSGGFDLREIYIDFKTENGNRLIVGQAEKTMGLGYDLNLEDRLGLSRGAAYRKLGSFGYVGRDTTISYRVGDLDDRDMSHDVSVHSSEGLNAALLYGFHWKVGEKRKLSAYSLAQFDIIDKHMTPGGAQVLSFIERRKEWRYEGELMLGHDPIETELNARVGGQKSFFFSAATAGGAYRLGDLEPFGRAGAIFHDLSDAGRRTHELAVGTRLHLRDRFMIGTELALHRAAGAEDLASASHWTLAMRYFF